MRFSLNLIELYNEMRNEYGEPVKEYISYKEFVEYFKTRCIGIIESATGDFLFIDVDVDEMDL